VHVLNEAELEEVTCAQDRSWLIFFETDGIILPMGSRMLAAVKALISLPLRVLRSPRQMSATEPTRYRGLIFVAAVFVAVREYLRAASSPVSRRVPYC